MHRFNGLRSSIILAALVLTSCSKEGFDKQATLSDYVAWSNTLPELPDPDNKDLLNPDYTSFYNLQAPGFISRTVARFKGGGVKNRAPWSPHIFLKTLKEISEARARDGLSRRHVAVLKAKPGTRIYVFGDLQGAFHSLLRDLTDLKRRGVIDDNFKIKNPNTYLVFNGKQVTRSPYILETLTVILLFMQQNKDNVIYNAGRHELDNTWADYGTLQEVNSRLAGNQSAIQIAKETLSIFFETLPVAFYIQDSTKSEKRVLKIYGHENAVANDENGIADELHAVKAGNLARIPVHLTSLQTETLVVDAVIKAVSRSTSYRQTDGLEMIQQENGAIAWSSLSSPTLTYRKLFGFFNDAYVLVEINDFIRNSTITLVKQDARRQNGFTLTTRHIITGQTIDPKANLESLFVEDSGLRFGTILDRSGPSRIVGQRVLSGIDLRFRKANSFGSFLRLFVRDDRSQDSRWVDQLLDLRGNYNATILVAPTTQNVSQSMLSEIKKESEYVLFPASGASAFRDPSLKNVINLRPSTKTEVCALIRYAKDTLFSRKVGVLFQNDIFGRDGLAAAKSLLVNRYGTQKADMCEISYEPNSLDMEKPAKDFKKCLPDALILVATQTAAQAFIHETGIQSLAKTTLFGVSNVSDLLRPSLHSATSNGGITVILSRVVPNPFDRSLKLVEHYQEAMDKSYAGALYNSESFEGYLATSVLMDAIASVDKPVTATKIMTRLESLKARDYKGLNLDFDPTTRELMNTVWIDAGGRKWIEFKSANSLCS